MTCPKNGCARIRLAHFDFVYRLQPKKTRPKVNKNIGLTGQADFHNSNNTIKFRIGNFSVTNLLINISENEFVMYIVLLV